MIPIVLLLCFCTCVILSCCVLSRKHNGKETRCSATPTYPAPAARTSPNSHPKVGHPGPSHTGSLAPSEPLTKGNHTMAPFWPFAGPRNSQGPPDIGELTLTSTPSTQCLDDWYGGSCHQCWGSFSSAQCTEKFWIYQQKHWKHEKDFLRAVKILLLY